MANHLELVSAVTGWRGGVRAAIGNRTAQVVAKDFGTTAAKAGVGGRETAATAPAGSPAPAT